MNLLEKRSLKTLNIFAIAFILDIGFNSKTSKMKLLEKTVKIFIKVLPIFAITFILDVVGLNTPQKCIFSGNTQKSNLTCSNSFCKVTGSKALISIKQDSTRE